MTTRDERHLQRSKQFWDSDESVRIYGTETTLSRGEGWMLHACFPDGAAGVRALDIGCGAGRTTHCFHKMGMKVTGIDISLTLLEHARRRYPDIEFREENAEDLNYDEEEFGAVMFMANGLDYLYPNENRLRCIAEIHRILKPGGYFFASHHNLVALLFGWYKMMRPWKLSMRLSSIVNGNVFRAGCYISHPRDTGGLVMRYSRPGMFVEEIVGAGFELEGVFPNSPVLACVQRRLRTTAMTKLCDPWPNYLFRKR